jgi:hypothetical protein
MWKQGRITRTPQGASDLPTFRVPPPEIMEVVRRKLSEGTYGYYANT